MSTVSNTFIINPLSPMELLIVESTLDNEYWLFCADEVSDDNGRFLEDDELTYDEFDLGPDAVLPAGTMVVMPHLWGWHVSTEGDTNFGIQTAVNDFIIEIPKAATVQHVVYVILSQYYKHMNNQNASGRFFFIENVREVKPGVVEIIWGT